jgi:hypothetical protein
LLKRNDEFSTLNLLLTITDLAPSLLGLWNYLNNYKINADLVLFLC